jgi:predicted nucleic-acid-binding Zn-ribbon protein
VGLFSKKKSETVGVAGKQLQCVVCGNDHFWQREAQLNTAGMTFLELDWANPSALCCVCDSCGYIHWFMPK